MGRPLGFRVYGLVFLQVEGLGFGVWGLGVRAWAWGFTKLVCPRAAVGKCINACVKKAKYIRHQTKLISAVDVKPTYKRIVLEPIAANYIYTCTTPCSHNCATISSHKVS